MGVIVGFNRRRDSYQAPLAFAEAGTLDRFVTDYYHPDRLPRIPVLSSRSTEGLPSALVTRSWRAFALQTGWELRQRRSSKNAPFPSFEVDSAIGRRIAVVAARSPASSLLIYSGYAAESFLQGSNTHRTLFQFHPTVAVYREALQHDELADGADWIPEPEVAYGAMRNRADQEITTATAFVTASSVTKRGLVLDGVAPDRIDVVPYGADVDPRLPPPLRTLAAPRFLFVRKTQVRKQQGP